LVVVANEQTANMLGRSNKLHQTPRTGATYTKLCNDQACNNKYNALSDTWQLLSMGHCQAGEGKEWTSNGVHAKTKERTGAHASSKSTFATAPEQKAKALNR
jgi:hypothetical protein